MAQQIIEMLKCEMSSSQSISVYGLCQNRLTFRFLDTWVVAMIADRLEKTTDTGRCLTSTRVNSDYQNLIICVQVFRSENIFAN